MFVGRILSCISMAMLQSDVRADVYRMTLQNEASTVLKSAHCHLLAHETIIYSVRNTVIVFSTTSQAQWPTEVS